MNEAKSCRKITLKGVYGDPEALSNFISNFKKKLQENLREHGVNSMEMKGFSILGADETNETEACSIKGAGAGNVSEISTYRSNVNSTRGK